MRRAPRSSERGMTLIEVMVAGAVLLVAVLGFVGTSRYAATATATGHRRTMTTFLRGELVDRLTVLPRASLATLAGYTGASASYVYVVDSCYDVDGQLLGSNTGFSSASYTCGTGTMYRSWAAAKDASNATWNVAIYVERVDPGCTAATRNSSVACSATDLILTD